ncbi:hypothetical protein O1611_g8180 [Lasiodiplodia mahajangana]|uniref:Uncharacterized protein n=1 Tax=Lasiodiplodia mahajangana TaxID=1108764 RepID=A0ACC2JDA8_9PEZI|nr:hypothetical protein O1611_g8180 [Lasiodiplodia mahajangana]
MQFVLLLLSIPLNAIEQTCSSIHTGLSTYGGGGSSGSRSGTSSDASDDMRIWRSSFAAHSDEPAVDVKRKKNDSTVCKRPQPSTGDDDEGGCAKVRDEVERVAYAQLARLDAWWVGLPLGCESHIKYVHSTLIHKEALEQPLNYNQSLAQHQHYRVDPSSAAMEDGQEGELRQKSEDEKNYIYEGRDDGKREQSAQE